jgi:hypothetical protein
MPKYAIPAHLPPGQTYGIVVNAPWLPRDGYVNSSADGAGRFIAAGPLGGIIDRSRRLG